MGLQMMEQTGETQMGMRAEEKRINSRRSEGREERSDTRTEDGAGRREEERWWVRSRREEKKEDGGGKHAKGGREGEERSEEK